MAKLFYATTLLSALAAVSALPADPNVLTAPDSNVLESSKLAKRELIKALPEKAADTELKYQPYFDFDTDSCYQTSAVDPSGKLNDGLQTKNQDVTSQGCREPPRLQNSNTYSRRRCNQDRCGIIYAYYYEKDSNGFGGGHTHDWEHVIVFSGAKGELLAASTSAHGDWTTKPAGQFPTSKDGNHPIVVYHKDSASTHAHRFANDNDIKEYENYTGNSFRAPLVGWLGWPAGLRDAVMGRDWGEASIELKDESFAAALEAAGARDYGLDPYGPDESTT